MTATKCETKILKVRSVQKIWKTRISKFRWDFHQRFFMKRPHQQKIHKLHRTHYADTESQKHRKKKTNRIGKEFSVVCAFVELVPLFVATFLWIRATLKPNRVSPPWRYFIFELMDVYTTTSNGHSNVIHVCESYKIEQIFMISQMWFLSHHPNKRISFVQCTDKIYYFIREKSNDRRQRKIVCFVSFLFFRFDNKKNCARLVSCCFCCCRWCFCVICSCILLV